MAIIVSTTNIYKVKENDRFEPRFYHMYNKFEEFESSSNFQILRLGDKRILKKITDGEHAGQTFVDSGIRFIKNSAVKDFMINLYDGFFISEEKHMQQNRSALKPLDILFTTIGHLGATCIIPHDFGEANINQNVVKLEIYTDFINPYYLAAYLNSNITKKQIAALFTGNIHSIITYPKIKDIRIIIPNKEFQNQVSVDYTKSIELEQKSHQLIADAQKIFKESIEIDFSEIKKNISYSVTLSKFVQDDLWTPAYSSPIYVNTTRLIQKKWQTIPLGDIVLIKKGDEVGSNSYNKYLEKKANDVPFIRTSDLINFEIDQYPDFYIPEEIYNELNQNLLEGDILFSKDGKIGMIGLITRSDRAIIASGIARLRLKKEARKYNITPEYLFIVLSLKETGLYPAIRRTVVASTIPHLREERLKEIEIPILKKESMDKITLLVKEAFRLKDDRKNIIRKIRDNIDSFFAV